MIAYCKEPILCRCGTSFEGELWSSVHVSRSPEVRDRILEGTFHRFECPACGQPVVVERRLAYIDVPRRQWFTVFPRIDLRHRDELVAFARAAFRETMIERAPELVQGWAAEMTERAVFGLASLREKLVVLEAGLDDRLIECLKLQLFRTAGLVLHPDTFLHVAAVESDELVFEYGAPGRRPTRLPVPRELYSLLGTQLGDERAQPRGELAWLFDDILVDYRAPLVPRTALVPAQVAGA
jgi:hypothetical protein